MVSLRAKRTIMRVASRAFLETVMTHLLDPSCLRDEAAYAPRSTSSKT